jgi:hypothetical protein
MRERESIKGKKLIGMQRKNTCYKVYMKNKRIDKERKGRSKESDRILNQQQ